MSAAVEVFEVGVEQISDLVRDGRLRDFTFDGMYVPCDGDFVVVECSGCLGYVSRPRLVVSYVSFFKALVAATAYLERNAHTTYAHDYEIWHVVDDAELWQMWEHDVAVSKRRRNEPTGWHVYHGGTCVLDVESVPTCLFRLRCVTANCEGVSDGWYIDAHGFVDALGMRVSCGWMPWHSFVRELEDCVAIVDDDCLELDDYGYGTVLTVVCQEFC